MMIVAVVYRYTDDVAARDRVLPEHRDYLRGLADQGVLLVSGPYGPGEPRGALLLFRADKARVNTLIANDPFRTSGVIATTEIAVWEPVIGALLAAIQTRGPGRRPPRPVTSADRPTPPRAFRPSMTTPEARASRIQGKETPMTDPRGEVGTALATMQARSVIRGIDLCDYQRLAEKVTTWDDWWDQWTAMGEQYLHLADRYESAGWPTSAGAARVRAGIAFHFGKALAVQDDPRYRELTLRSVEAVATGLRLLDPSFERIEVPFDGHYLAGNLRRPHGTNRPPLVLLIPGTESVKEEFPQWEEEFLARGMATLSMDGPGQGEVGFELGIRHDYEHAVSALLDALTGRTDLDLNRIAAAGVSLGGYYAIRSAAFEPRITAVLANCGPWSLAEEWDRMPALYRAKYAWNLGGGSESTARARARAVTLDGVAERVTVPTLVIFGGADVLLDADQHGRRTAQALPKGELWMFQQGNHGVTNHAAEHQGPAADWLHAHM